MLAGSCVWALPSSCARICSKVAASISPRANRWWRLSIADGAGGVFEVLGWLAWLAHRAKAQTAMAMSPSQSRDEMIIHQLIPVTVDPHIMAMTPYFHATEGSALCGAA
jgi:hypothetical protein